MNSNNVQLTGISSQFLFIMAALCFLLVVLSHTREEDSRAPLQEAIAKVSEFRGETIQARDEECELK